jgi:hypothetical protein
VFVAEDFDGLQLAWDIFSHYRTVVLFKIASVNYGHKIEHFCELMVEDLAQSGYFEFGLCAFLEQYPVLVIEIGQSRGRQPVVDIGFKICLHLCYFFMDGEFFVTEISQHAYLQNEEDGFFGGHFEFWSEVVFLFYLAIGRDECMLEVVHLLQLLCFFLLHYARVFLFEVCPALGISIASSLVEFL